MEAVRATAGEQTPLIPIVTAELEIGMWEKAEGQINVEQIEQRMAELRAQTMELINQSISSHTVDENGGKLKALSDELRSCTIC